MPPRRSAPRRRKHSASSSTQASDKPKQEECERSASFSIGDGNEEIRWLWPLLSRSEKFHILDVTADEILTHLFQTSSGVPDETRKKIENLLGDPNYATGMRVLFVTGLDSSATDISLPPDFPTASLAFLQILNSHLLETYDRYHSSALLWLFAPCWLLFISSFELWAKCIFLISVVFVLGSFPERKLWVIPEDVFESVFSNSAQRLQLVIQNVMLYSLSYWSPHCTLIKWVSLVPFLLLILKDSVSGEDTRCLSFFHWLLSMAMKIVVLYFAWYSWICTLSVLAVLLPSLFTLSVHVAVVLCQIGVLCLEFLVNRVQFLNRLTTSLADFALFPIILFYAMYFQSIWASAVAILLIPALGRNALLNFSSVIPSLTEKSSTLIIFSFMQLGFTVAVVLICNCVIRGALGIRTWLRALYSS